MRLRLFLLVLILPGAFALRVHGITSFDLNVDESWSYWHAYHIPFPDEGNRLTPVWALGDEPNNAFHLILTSLALSVVPNAFGLRWLSIVCGLVTVALSARIAYRLFGRHAVLPASIVVATAYWPLWTSQNGRPYALETALVTASLLSWLERKRFTNLVTSGGAVLAHIGAMPIILLQEILTFGHLARNRWKDRYLWLFNRVLAYGAALGVIFLVRTREAATGRAVSFGQSLPSLNDIVQWIVSLLFNGLTDREPWKSIILVGFVLPLAGVLAYLLYRRKITFGIQAVLLWITLSCAALVALAAVGNGAIKFVHLSHVAVAVALLTGALWVRIPRLVAWGLLTIYCGTAIFALSHYYSNPYTEFSQTVLAIDELRDDGAVFYTNDEYIHRALLLNGGDKHEIQYILPPIDQRSTHYWFINFQWGGFILPEVPPECEAKPTRIVGDTYLHQCR